MPVALQIIRRNEQKTSSWSGGTTTQIAIFPADADYKARNFDWRISSATVDIDRSTFTSLPGIERTLMILRGNILVEHEGHYRKQLGPFEQDSFNGGWITHAIGRATDFNLMCAAGCRGELRTLELADALQVYEENVIISSNNHPAWELLYAADGALAVSCAGITEILSPGDLLLVHRHLLEADTVLSVAPHELQDYAVFHAILGTVQAFGKI